MQHLSLSFCVFLRLFSGFFFALMLPIIMVPETCLPLVCLPHRKQWTLDVRLSMSYRCRVDAFCDPGSLTVVVVDVPDACSAAGRCSCGQARETPAVRSWESVEALKHCARASTLAFDSTFCPDF